MEELHEVPEVLVSQDHGKDFLHTVHEKPWQRGDEGLQVYADVYLDTPEVPSATSELILHWPTDLGVQEALGLVRKFAQAFRAVNYSIYGADDKQIRRYFDLIPANEEEMAILAELKEKHADELYETWEEFSDVSEASVIDANCENSEGDAAMLVWEDGRGYEDINGLRCMNHARFGLIFMPDTRVDTAELAKLVEETVSPVIAHSIAERLGAIQSKIDEIYAANKQE